MPFEMVPTEDPLPADARSCLLRAARRQLLTLTDEMRRLESLSIKYAAAPMAATQQEIDCLSSGIAWLWRLPG